MTAPLPRKREDGQQPTRLEKARADRRDPLWCPNYPHTDAPHLIAYLWDAGPALPGPAPLTHSEINAWQQSSGVELAPWEARLLRRLSAEYLAETRRATDANCPEPSAQRLTDADRARISSKVQQGLRMLMNTRPKR